MTPTFRTLAEGCHPNRETWTAIAEAGFQQVPIEHFRLPVPLNGPHIAGSIGMRKRTFTLTASQAQELQAAYHHSRDGATRTRYQAVRLYGQGYAVNEIQAIDGCSRRSLQEWRQSI